MRRWAWIFAALLLAAAAVSLLRRARPTAGEELLAAIDGHNLPTREALLLLDYTPDPELLAAARSHPVERGEGPAPGLGLEPYATVDQHWIRSQDTALFYPRPNALRAALPTAVNTLHDLIDPTTLAAAADQLQKLPDEQLFLDWIHADRGVIAELNDPTDAARQALLLQTIQNPGPILTFPIRDHHVYLFPNDKTPNATWCTLAIFNSRGGMQLSATLRLDDAPPPQHVRTMAVLLAEEVLQPPATKPAIPQLLHF
ncbi:MAG: hypothetical protein ACTHN5_11165 [Phycisphaerae bacterium]